MNMMLVAGSFGLVVGGLSALSPAAAQGKDPPGVNLAQYQCYRITEQTPFRHVGMTVKDPFGTADVKLLKPILLCAPTAKNGAAAKDSKTHLVCYQADGGKSADKTVTITNQFGTETVKVAAPSMVCVPSLKGAAKP